MSANRRSIGLLLAIVTLSSFWGCNRSAENLETLKPKKALNVLLIVVDTLPAMQLGAYNAKLSNSPKIDALAASGAKFSQARSISSWTKPSITSIFTSKMPWQHGVTAMKDRLEDHFTTITEEFKTSGYDTVGFVSHTILAKKSGLAQGFDLYEQLNQHHNVHAAITSGDVADSAINWLKQHQESSNRNNFFMFLHLFDPHFRYMDHEEFHLTDGYKGQLKSGMSLKALAKRKSSYTLEDTEYLKNLQREEIAFTDKHIGRVIDYLKNNDLTSETLVVLTADHGEEFMEHGSLGHTETLFEEIVHIPLIFSLPGSIPSLVDDTPVNLLDVMPTILDLALGKRSTDFQGASLAETLLAGKKFARTRDLFAEVAYKQVSNDDILSPNIISVISEGIKLMHDRGRKRWLIYDLTKDPGELNNLAKSRQDLLAKLKAKLEFLEEIHDRGFKKVDQNISDKNQNREDEMTSDEMQKLKSLGYL